jgi:hypothetical protein
MKCLRAIYLNHYLFCFTLIVALLTAACENQNTTLPISAESEGKITFTGTWSATGNRQTMHLESGHRTDIFWLTGSLMLYGPQRPTRGFKAEIIGFSDNQTGMQGRSVWTDNFGDKVFSKLDSDTSDPGTLINGTFIGGTGRYSSLMGEYTFKWKRMINNENGVVSGRVVDLNGWAKLQAPDNLPPTTGQQQ